jgi:hypothetical protein
VSAGIVKHIAAEGRFGFARVLDPYDDQPTTQDIYLPRQALLGLARGDRITFDEATKGDGKRYATNVRHALAAQQEVSDGPDAA